MTVITADDIRNGAADLSDDVRFSADAEEHLTTVFTLVSDHIACSDTTEALVSAFRVGFRKGVEYSEKTGADDSDR